MSCYPPEHIWSTKDTLPIEEGRPCDCGKAKWKMFYEDVTITCGRHPEMSCTQAHDAHVKGLIDRDKRIEELENRIVYLNEAIAELKRVI